MIHYVMQWKNETIYKLLKCHHNNSSYWLHNMYSTLLHQLYESFKTVAHRIIIKEMLPFLRF